MKFASQKQLTESDVLTWLEVHAQLSCI